VGGAWADAIVACFDASAKPFALDVYITNYEVCVLAVCMELSGVLRSSHAIQHGTVRPALGRHALLQLFAALADSGATTAHRPIS